MAAMIASKRGGPIAKLFEKLLLNPARPLEASTLSAARSFNKSAQMKEVDADERGLDVDRRRYNGRVARRRRRDDVDSPFFSGSRLHFNN